ncbi:hypothetical protein AAD001_13580 [Colwelliaceae bacterium 6471]
MKIWIHFIRAPIRVVSLSRRRTSTRFKRQMIKLKIALAQEKTETREMLSIYRRYTQRQATKEEMQIANQQFLDVIKGLGIGVVAVLPFAPITIPIMIKIARLAGVEILPSSFSETRKELILDEVKDKQITSNNSSID